MNNNDGLGQRLTKTIPEWCSLLKYSMIKLYFADKSQKFKYSLQAGALCLIIDRKQYSTKYLKLYDVSAFTVTFELELYLNFSQTYKKLTNEFYSFPISTGWGGFLFQNEEEARAFNDKIEQFSDNGTPDTLKRGVDWLSKGNVSEILSSSGSMNGSAFFVNKNYFKKFKVSDKIFMELSSIHISKPTNIERTNNVGWDPINQNFKLEELPKELKQLLRQAGITKKDLKEKAIALMIYEILINPRQLDSILAKMKGTFAKKESPKKEMKKTTIVPNPAEIQKDLKQSFARPMGSISNAEEIIKKPSIMGMPNSQTVEETKAGEDPPELYRNSKSIAGLQPPQIGVPAPPMTQSSSMVAPPKAIPGNFLDQIRAGKFNLKKADANKNTVFKDLIDNKELRMKAASTLHAAIVERRGQLTKNAVKDSDDEDDGWSDED